MNGHLQNFNYKGTEKEKKEKENKIKKHCQNF